MINWVKHSSLQDGEYPEYNSTKVAKIESNSVGNIIDSSFTKEGLLQFTIDFDGKVVIVPYYKVSILFPEMRKNGH